MTPAIQTMTQEQKDQLLARLLAKEATEQRAARYAALGLSRSPQGYIVVRQPDAGMGDKAAPVLHISPKFLGKLQGMMDDIVEFATAHQ